MTHWRDRRDCPDCGALLSDINIIDHAHKNAQRQVEYAAGDAEYAAFLGIIPIGYPIAGVVKAKMCDGCGRIVLYAAPRVEPKLE